MDAEPAEPGSEPTPAEPGYDPFAGDMPDAMADALVLQLDGRPLEAEMQRALYAYGQQHPMDARPWLLLARDSMAREWAAIAVRQYGMALTADPRVADAPFVLADLLTLVRLDTGSEQEEARALVIAYWGEAALDAAD